MAMRRLKEEWKQTASIMQMWGRKDAEFREFYPFDEDD